MGKQNYFFSGITDILILAILCEHDSYVYEIVKFIKEKSNGCLSISQNTVYAVTYKLVNEGKISEYSKLVGKKRTRIYYHIEDEVPGRSIPLFSVRISRMIISISESC